MSGYSEKIKNLSEEIVNSLPFLLDSRVNEAASVIIFNNMEECLKLASSVQDMQIIGSAFQMCVNYAKKYNIDGLRNACSKWNDIACDKLDSFKEKEVLPQEISLEEKISQRLDCLEVTINDPDIKDKEVLTQAMEEINSLEEEVRMSTMDSNVIKSVRYRIAMLRESLNVSLVIVTDMSNVYRLLRNAKR